MLAEYRMPVCGGAAVMVCTLTGRGGLTSRPCTLEQAVARPAASRMVTISRVLIGHPRPQVRNRTLRSRTLQALADTGRCCPRDRRGDAAHRTAARLAAEIDRS